MSEELQTSWKARSQSPQFSQYKDAIRSSLDKLAKYYNKFDEKPVYVLALSKFCVVCMHYY